MERREVMDPFKQALIDNERRNRRRLQRIAKSLANSITYEQIERWCKGLETASPSYMFSGRALPTPGETVQMLLKAKEELGQLRDRVGVLEIMAAIWKVCIDKRLLRDAARIAAQ